MEKPGALDFEAQTVLWDLDGTILDSMSTLESGLREVLPAYGIEPPVREVVAMNFHGSLEESIGAMVGGNVEPARLQTIIRDFLAVQDTFYDVIGEHLYPDALELMARYHSQGRQQVLVTNREHVGRLRASPRSIVAHSELGSYIDVVVCGDDSEHRKPSPEVLDLVRSAGAVALDDVLVIGDQVVDAQFAHNIGGHALLVARQGDVRHMDRLTVGWESRTTVVATLAAI